MVTGKKTAMHGVGGTILSHMRNFVCFILVLASSQWCVISHAAEQDLEGVRWRLLEAGSMQASDPAGGKQPSMFLDPGQRKVTGFTGCNSFFAAYEVDGASLRFGPAGSTRQACPDLETGVETAFLDALSRTRGWKIEDGDLLLTDGGAVLARFVADRPELRLSAVADGYVQAGPEIAGPVWQWVETTYNDDSSIVPAKSENYTVRFTVDGNVDVKADCNRKGGTYSLQDSALSIRILRSTMAACEEGSLEDRFAGDLTAAEGILLRDGDLFISLKYDSGTMRFSKQK